MGMDSVTSDPSQLGAGRLRPHPVLRDAVRLLRLRDVDGSRRDHRRVRRGVPHAARASRRRRGSPPRDVGVLRRWHPVPARSPRPGLDPRPDPARPRCRGHGRVQPRLGRRGEARRVPSGGCDPPVVRRPVDGRPRARRARPDARPRERRARGGRGTRRRVRDVQPRPDLRHPGGEPRRLARHAGRGARARAAARQRVRAHGRAGDGARATRRGGRARARRRRPGHEVRDRRRAAHRRGSALVRGVELGAAGARVPAQPPHLARRRLPRDRVRRPRPPPRTPVVERPDPGEVRGADRRGRGPDGGGGGARRRRRAPRSRSSWRCGPARGRSSRTAPARRPSASRRAACSDSTTAERC